MARITVEGCLDKVASRFELILLASGRARQLSTTSREAMVEWEDDKPTIVALREIEEGLDHERNFRQNFRRRLVVR